MTTLLSIARDYRDVWHGAHRNVRLFFLGSFLAQISGGFFGILYNLYIKNLGLPDTVAGAYVSAGSIAGALFLVPAGILSDRIGRRRAILYAGLLAGIVNLSQAFFYTPFLMVTGAFLAGAVGSMVWVSILPLLADNTAKEERFHLFSVNFAIGLLAQVIGSMVAGGLSTLLVHLLANPVWALRLTLLLGGLIGLFALVPFSKIQEKPRQRHVSGKQRQRKDFFGQFRGQRKQLLLILKFALSAAFIGFGAGLVIPYLNLYFVERFHMANAGVGVVIGLAQACTALAMFIGPALANRLGPVKAVVLFQLLSIPFLLITGWAMNLWFASVAVIIRNALMNSSNPIQDSIMMALVNEKMRGFAVSCGQTMFTLGWAVMGPVSTYIVHRHGAYTGYAIVFSGTAVLYLIGSCFYGISFKKYESQVSSQSEQPVSA
jgi:MFS family permease